MIRLVPIAAILLGGAMIEMAVTDPSLDTGSNIAAAVFGIILLVPGLAAAFVVFSDKRGRGTIRAADLSRKIRNTFFPSFAGDKDRNETDALLSRFRADYAAYYHTDSPVWNTPVQREASQVYWNIMEFKKQRLKAAGVAYDFCSERMRYGAAPSVRASTVWDGRYSVTEAAEDISASVSYKLDGTVLYKREYSQTAHYTLTMARRNGPHSVICPNCGNAADRDGLLDGCDYCGTKFTVEDLGLRVTGFALRDEYGLQYEKYKKYRAKFKVWVGVFIAAVVGLFSAYWTFRIMPELIAEENMGPFMTIISVAGTIALPTAAAVYFGMWFFTLTVFPWIQLGAYMNWYPRKKLEMLKQAEEKDKEAEKAVRRHDSLFSLAGFYSGVQNKLAAIHYAEDARQINAFSTCDLASLLPEYRSVLNMDITSMRLEGYSVSEGRQTAKVAADARLLVFDGKRCRERDEHISLIMSKAAACKTLSVCAPSLLTCRSCGASLSLLEGGICPYCGTKLDLEAHDWIIREYSV